MVRGITFGTKNGFDVIRDINGLLVVPPGELAGLDFGKHFFERQADRGLVERGITTKTGTRLLFQFGVGYLDAALGEAFQDLLQGDLDGGAVGWLGGDQAFQLGRQGIHHSLERDRDGFARRGSGRRRGGSLGRRGGRIRLSRRGCRWLGLGG
jgi:hypothetical protein